ncbi:DUF5810 domain-containing protein [Halobacteriaceae archaeon SHR40]|uniref:DUF5810 domain-containing protein n=1 Tax=Halovenus amylolytica TaxID=2500550 RepID=UPI000FE38E63
MGFSCPVCDDPQADGVHLANHLAITALTRGGDHEAWLDEHVPEWANLSEEELAEQVQEMAEDADYPQVFEDTTTGHEHTNHDHAGEHGHGDATEYGTADLPQGGDMLADDLDGGTEDVIREAMEMTRQRTSDDAPAESETEDSDEATNSETE